VADPIAIFTVGVQRISEVTEAMLGPAIFVIVHALLKEDRIAVLIAQEKPSKVSDWSLLR
jgi:hypothetical protein